MKENMELKIIGTAIVLSAGGLLFFCSISDEKGWHPGLTGIALFGLGLYLLGTIR